MFTNFGRKIEKVKAKMLNQPVPIGAETWMENNAQRLKKRVEEQVREKEEQRIRSIADSVKLKQEFTREFSRASSTIDTITTHSKEHEVILSNNNPEQNVQTLGGVCGGSTLTKLKDDGYGVFKPYDNFEIKERKLQIQNERAAYLVDLFLGFDLVPPTVIRALSDPESETEQVGSMQQFVEDAGVGACLSNNGKDDVDPGEIAKLGIFDFMIKSSDRHSSNYLIKDRKVFAIDHGLCFASKIEGLRNDEQDNPESVLSGEYYDLVNRADLFNSETFWDLELPLENREKLKAFNASEKDRAIFLQLFQELLGERKAKLFLHRITSIITALDDEGKLNQHVLKEILGGILEKHYAQQEEPAAAA